MSLRACPEPAGRRKVEGNTYNIPMLYEKHKVLKYIIAIIGIVGMVGFTILPLFGAF